MDKQGKLKIGYLIRGYYLFPILVGVVGLLLSIGLYFVNLNSVTAFDRFHYFCAHQ